MVDKQEQKPTMFQVALSVLAAGFGVQSSKNRERDFKQGNAITFVVVGLIATILFVLIIFGTVTLVLG